MATPAAAPGPAAAPATVAPVAPAAAAATAAPAPAAAAASLAGEQLSAFARHGWLFQASRAPLWGTERIDELMRLQGFCKVPDMYCGDAALRIRHAHSSFALDLNAPDALLCCRWRPAPVETLLPPRLPVVAAAGATECGSAGNVEKESGPMLGNVRCQFADRWKPHGVNPDVKKLEVTSDWTCCTPYWGSVGPTPQGATEVTDEGLPMELLQRRDEIRWYNEVLFWEDELADNGLCRLSVRVRVMPKFWFALLLCELRVDNVLLREVATRFFHAFDSDHVLREWTCKEATYDALRARGLELGDNPQISQASIGTTLLEQADIKRQLRHRLRLCPGRADGGK